MRFFLLILLLIPVASIAEGSGKTFVTETFLEGLKNSAKKRCTGTTLLRRCFSVNQETCESRVSSRLEGCIRDQRIRLMGQNKIIELAARAVESEVDSCVNTEYYSLSRSSFKPSPACDQFSRKSGASSVAASVAPVKDRSQVYEDPLEGQRSVTDNYKLRLISDLRRVQAIKVGLASRKVCPGYQGKDSSGCFRQALSNFEITSSPLIAQMMVVATYAGLMDRDSGHARGRELLVDNILAVFERTDLHKFHLNAIKPRDDREREELALLHKDDEKLLQMTLQKTESTLAPYLNESGGRLQRQPSSTVDFRGRLDFQLKRGWEY